MSKKRKSRRIPKAQGLADIPKNELAQWKVYGPMIGDKYESWQEWTEVYKNCREELLARIEERLKCLMSNPALKKELGEREHRPPACERIYQAILAGQDPDQVKNQIAKELEEEDPRKRLGV